MCAVSAVSAVSAVMDYGRTVPIETWTLLKFIEYRKLVDGAKEFDKNTGQPDCEDPRKVALMEEILTHLKKIGERLDRIEVQRS